MVSAQLTVRILLPNIRSRLMFYVDGFASMIVSLATLSSNGEWSATRGELYGVFVGAVLCHGLLATFAAKIMHKLQTWFVIANVALIIATVIALPIGRHVRNLPLNSAKYVFGHSENATTWPAGWAFMLAWLSPIWTIGAFDSCVHMSEEANNARKAVPIGVLASIGGCWSLGFLTTAVMAACSGTDFQDILATPFGQPMAQVRNSDLGISLHNI